MYVVVQIGSTQHKVDEKDEILVPHLKVEEGKNYKIEKVLLYVDESQNKVLIGTPYLDQVKVEGRVMNHEKGEKVTIFKMKPKKHYKRKAGFRPFYSRLKILKISLHSGSNKETLKEEPEINRSAPIEKIVERPNVEVPTEKKPVATKVKKAKTEVKTTRKTVSKAKPSTAKTPRKRIKKEE